MKQIKRGEIWVVNLNPTVGREQQGTRPVLIFSNDIFNQGGADLVFGIPLTSQSKGYRMHVAVSPPEGGLKLPSFIMCEALRSLSKNRFQKKLGSIFDDTMFEVEERIKMLMDL